MILKSICSGTHNQCRLRRSGVIWSYLLATKMSHAAAFRSDWSLLALTCLRAVCCVHSAIECPDYQSCTKVLMVFSVKWELLAGSLFSPVVLMAVVEFVGHLISHSVCICSYVLFLCKLFSFCFFYQVLFSTDFDFIIVMSSYLFCCELCLQTALKNTTVLFRKSQKCPARHSLANEIKTLINLNIDADINIPWHCV